MNKLTDRLQILSDHVLPGLAAADIGTDHGFLPIHLLSENIVPYVVLTDINEGPLGKAENNLKNAGVDLSRCCLRLGSGLLPVFPGEAATVIIAGMGGELISEILEAEPEKTASFKRFVLQPRTRSAHLRRTLIRMGFSIIDEHLSFEERKLSEIIVAESGHDAPMQALLYLNDEDMELPPVLFERKDPLLNVFLTHKENSLRRVINGLENSKDDHSQKAAYCLKILAAIEERRKNL